MTLHPYFPHYCYRLLKTPTNESSCPRWRLTLAIVMPSLPFTGHYCYEIIRLRVYVMLWQTYQRKDMTSPSVAKSPRTFCSASSSRARARGRERKRDVVCSICTGVGVATGDSRATRAHARARARAPRPRQPTHARERTSSSPSLSSPSDAAKMHLNFKGDNGAGGGVIIHPARYHRVLPQSYHLSSSI